MPHQRFYGRAESPTLDLVVDMGNPILNSTVNGFLKVAPVGATHAATQRAFRMIEKESVTKRDLKEMVKLAGQEGLQWGLVAGIYSGTLLLRKMHPFFPAQVVGPLWFLYSTNFPGTPLPDFRSFVVLHASSGYSV